MRRVDLVFAKVLSEVAGFIRVAGKNNPWRSSLNDWKGLELAKLIPFLERVESWTVHEPCEWLSKLVFYG
jgi:hypothetical protein